LRQQYFHTYGTTLRGLQIHHHVDSEAYLETVHQLPIADCIRPNPALVDRLTRLRAPFAIFTNSPHEHAVRVLHQIGFNEIFFPIIDIRMMQFQPKPHPTAYQIALDVIAQPASSVYLFEDTLHNLAYAHAIGMRTVYIGASSPSSLPTYVDASFTTAVDALDALMTF
jgi:putative hydrolase of the HAD superfamily